MAVCYQSRKIHKGNYNYHKSFKISSFDFIDHEKSIKANNIPIWQCSKCTFKNITRKSHCSICNLSYKQSKSYKSKQSKLKSTFIQPKNKGFSNKPKNSQATLGDFCDNIVQELKPSVPVWICNVCTYCNIQQLPSCQICFNPYSQNKHYGNNQPDYEYVSSAEQQIIIDSVNLAQKQQIDTKTPKKRAKFSMDKLIQLREKQCESMPQNIINDIPEILSPGLGIKMPPKLDEKKAKFSMDKLMKLRQDKECQLMPENIINNIPEILSFGIGVKTQKTNKNRAKFSMEKLMKLRENTECESMPENIINEIPEILSLGLGVKTQKKCGKRDKFTVDELIKLRKCESYKLMPENIINEVPDILSPGLGRKIQPKRAKFSMDKLRELRHDKQCQIMPENIINNISEILSVGLGMKTQQKTRISNAKRSKYAMSKLMKLQKCKECHSMPLNIINEIPEILSFGLGHKHRNKPKRIKFTIKQLIGLKHEKICKHMPNNINYEIPEILAPGLGIIKARKRRSGLGFIRKQRLCQRNCNKFTKTYCFYSEIKNKQDTISVHKQEQTVIAKIPKKIEMNGNVNMDKFYRKKKFYLKQKYKKIIKRNRYKKKMKNKDTMDEIGGNYNLKRCVQRKWSSHWKLDEL